MLTMRKLLITLVAVSTVALPALADETDIAMHKILASKRNIDATMVDVICRSSTQSNCRALARNLVKLLRENERAVYDAEKYYSAIQAERAQ